MKTLILYYSKAGENWFDGEKKFLEKGNTQICAEFIKECTGGDMLPLIMKHPYSDDYDQCCEEARIAQQKNDKPELVNLPESIDEYDTIYLCYPIYWSMAPMAVLSFLEKYDFANKKIYPLSTHEGSGLGASVSTIRFKAKGAEVLDPLPIPGTLASKSHNRIKNWVETH